MTAGTLSEDALKCPIRDERAPINNIINIPSSMAFFLITLFLFPLYSIAQNAIYCKYPANSIPYMDLKCKEFCRIFSKKLSRISTIKNRAGRNPPGLNLKFYFTYVKNTLHFPTPLHDESCVENKF